MRRPFVRAALYVMVFFTSLLPQHGQGQSWPVRPVKLILASPPGSPPDVLARQLGARLQERFGQAFVVENKPGANTLIGLDACAKAPPDGYTFCVTTNDSMSVNPHLYSKLPYDPDKSFTPVAILAWPVSLITVHASTGIKTFDEMVAMSKAKPGTMNWGSFGNGSTSHLYLEWIRVKTDWDVTHVAYPNSGAMMQAVISGQVQLTTFAMGVLKPHIDSGKLLPIAIAGLKRHAAFPNVPTFPELGLGDFFVRPWFGMFAPAGTSADVVQKVNEAAVATVNDNDFRAKIMSSLTLEPGSGSPAEIASFLKADRESGAILVKAARVKLD